MTRRRVDPLLAAFQEERRQRALGRNPRPFRQARRYPGYLSVPTGRPIGSRREPADSAWTDVAVIGWCIAALLFVYWLAGWMPR